MALIRLLLPRGAYYSARIKCSRLGVTREIQILLGWVEKKKDMQAPADGREKGGLEWLRMLAAMGAAPRAEDSGPPAPTLWMSNLLINI